MSLIKSVDVPKHIADRMRSRRIAARLSSGVAKSAVPAKDAIVSTPVASVNTPTT